MFFLPAPFQNICSCSTSAYICGGLERTDNTACMRPPRPSAVRYDRCRRYLHHIARTFFSRYFHAWNIKSIKPAAFVPYDLDKKTMPNNWAFQSVTSYYDAICFWHAASSPNLIKPAGSEASRTSTAAVEADLGGIELPRGTDFTNRMKTAPTCIVSCERARIVPWSDNATETAADILDTLMDKLYRE